MEHSAQGKAYQVKTDIYSNIEGQALYARILCLLEGEVKECPAKKGGYQEETFLKLHAEPV
jgi:hypothetical protein